MFACLEMWGSLRRCAAEVSGGGGDFVAKCGSSVDVCGVRKK